MAYNEDLAHRVRELVAPLGKTSEMAMFGGLAFMLNGNMLVGVLNDDLMVRVGPDRHESVLSLKGARPMDFTKRPMRGFVFVDSSGTSDQRSLSRWISRAFEYVSGLPPKTSNKSGGRSHRRLSSKS